MVPRPEATGVFLVRLRAVFRSGFRFDPMKSWRSESSTSCMSVSSFQRTRLVDQLVASQEDSARKRGNVGKKVPEFSAQPYFVSLFHSHGRYSSRCRISAILVSSESWCYYFPKVQALHRGELGFARYDPANGGRWNVPYAKGSSSD
jgi:hypothetical protein